MEKGKSLFIIAILLIFSSIFMIFFLFRENIFVIKGNSMQPTLVHGDIVIIVDKPAEKIIADELNGDIVVISEGSNSYVKYGGASLFYDTKKDHKIIHRVVDKRLINETWFFLTKGDSDINAYCDGGIREIYRDSSGEYILFEYNSSNLVYIPESEILGVVILKIPLIGILKDYSILIFILIMLIFGTNLILKLLNRKMIIIRYETKQKLYRSKALIVISLFLFGQIIFSFLISPFYFMINESMEPYLKYNDLLLLEEKPASQIQIGDVCVIRGPDFFYANGFDPMFWNYYPNGSIIVHRILDKKIINDTWYFMTGGDKSPIYIDGMLRTLQKTKDYLLIEFNRSNIIYIPEQEIIGILIERIPFFGYLRDLMPYLGTFLIIIIGSQLYFLQTKRSIRLFKELKAFN